jgi:hypothetical protein
MLRGEHTLMVRFECLMAVSTKSTIFSDITLRRLIFGNVSEDGSVAIFRAEA